MNNKQSKSCLRFELFELYENVYFQVVPGKQQCPLNPNVKAFVSKKAQRIEIKEEKDNITKLAGRGSICESKKIISKFA